MNVLSVVDANDFDSFDVSIFENNPRLNTTSNKGNLRGKGFQSDYLIRIFKIR